MSVIRAYAAKDAKGQLEPFAYNPGALSADQVEIKVAYCGICHSDLSMLENDWQMTQYPFVPGHEIAGEISAVGSNVKHLRPGQKVGLGWFSAGCMTCPQCREGYLNFCHQNEQTIVGRHGGFGERVRCHWSWAMPLPDKLDLESSGPLFCGGITTFSPIVEFGIRPTDRVGVVGIGGLGHLALQFLNKWGCHVTAFTSSASKAETARKFGAHAIIDSRDDGALQKAASQFDLILSTVNVSLNWDLYINALAPRGRLHLVGAVMEPIPVQVFPLMLGQKSVSASPFGRPAVMEQMLQFCQRHNIAPQVETFPMAKVNEAMQHLKDGQARYRIVLKNDF